jgi:glutathione peroxidase
MGLFTVLLEKFAQKKDFGKAKGSIYDFKVKSIKNTDVDLAQWKGSNLLIVNTASKCGYTYQYDELQKLHEQYGGRLKVIGFPANNFLMQEPGNNTQIEEFCRINFGVTFPMMQKISVKGSDKHPLYQWLSAKTGREPSWNFCKYLVTNNGETVTFFPSTTRPMDDAILKLIA